MNRELYKDLFKEDLEAYDVVELLNELSEKWLMEETDHYHDGGWMHASVLRSKTEDLLTQCIIDIEAYRVANNKFYSHSDNEDEIGLSLLVDQVGGCIMYDRGNMSYYER